MSENSREFENVSGAEIVVFAAATPVLLYEGSKIYEEETHYPATNTDFPSPTAHDWHPNTLETAGVGLILPLLGAVALAAVTNGVRRFVHNRR